MDEGVGKIVALEWLRSSMDDSRALVEQHLTRLQDHIMPVVLVIDGCQLPVLIHLLIRPTS